MIKYMQTTELVEIFKALGDSTRLKIVRTLARERGECASCSEVSSISDLSQPAMSHHLTKLVEAGVLSEERRGKEKIYELNTAYLEKLGIDIDKLTRKGVKL